MISNQSIGIFDSGLGGLTILKEIIAVNSEYSYLYLGDNARAPYGSKSFETVFHNTWQCVEWLFEQGCNLVILACNTASARALRQIQQTKLHGKWGNKKVLGVIRPTAEIIGMHTKNKNIGILGTEGTINSKSYLNEIKNFWPKLIIAQQACPMWVPFIENNDTASLAIEQYVKKDMEKLYEQNAEIDTLLLACTHYPLILNIIKKYAHKHTDIISQGPIIALSLKKYLQKHNEIPLAKAPSLMFYTTDDPFKFNQSSLYFLGEAIESKHALIY